LSASAKADTVIADNPGVSLDDLVAAKKLNADQKAQILKKPGLQGQLALLEDQLNQFRAFAQDLEDRHNKEKASLVEAHEAEIATIKEEAAKHAEKAQSKSLEEGLRVISHFLHAAASKRQSEDADSEEGRAFEGALLLVYQGNDASLGTLKSLIYGADEKVPDVRGELLDFTFAQVKQSALQEAQDLAPPTEEEEVEETEPEAAIQTDPTAANARLTELEDTTIIQTNTPEPTDGFTAPEQTSTAAEAANVVAEASWDPQASIITDNSATAEEWVQVQRDPAETDTGVAATPAAIHGENSWAEEVGAAAEEKAKPENDGFEQVRRDRGRGRGRGGRGDFRGGRGRGPRGDGYRGRGGAPRGGRGAPRGDKS